MLYLIEGCKTGIHSAVCKTFVSVAASTLPHRGLQELLLKILMEKIAANFKNWTAKQISELSHKEEGYQKISKGKAISYEYSLNFSLNILNIQP